MLDRAVIWAIAWTSCPVAHFPRHHVGLPLRTLQRRDKGLQRMDDRDGEAAETDENDTRDRSAPESDRPNRQPDGDGEQHAPCEERDARTAPSEGGRNDDEREEGIERRAGQDRVQRKPDAGGNRCKPGCDQLAYQDRGSPAGRQIDPPGAFPTGNVTRHAGLRRR